MKAHLAAFGVAANLALAGAAHAATVPLPLAAQVGPVSESPASGAAQAHALQPAAPALAFAADERAAPAPGADPAAGEFEASAMQRPQPRAAGAAPLHSYLLSAGQYVLEVSTLSEPSSPSARKTISEVPLPGALWLFGSALLAFLAISSRRKL